MVLSIIKRGGRVMNIIVAVNSDWGIGCDGTQVITLPEDRRFFKEKTTSGTVIAGRKTFEDFPGALPDRKNIVLTKDKTFHAKGVTVLHSIEEVLEEIKNEDPDKVFVAGGGNIYKQLLPLCDTAFVTKLEVTPPSDTYFPNLDKLQNWSLQRQSEPKESSGIKYTINIYRNTCSPRKEPIAPCTNYL